MHGIAGCCWHHSCCACAHRGLAAHSLASIHSEDRGHEHESRDQGTHEHLSHEHGTPCPGHTPGKHSCNESRCWMMASGGGQGPAYRLASLPLVGSSIIKFSLLATPAERQALMAPHAAGSHPTLVALHQILLV